MNNKLLFIIDPQIDFITGTLPVPDAKKAMDSLSEYLRLHNADYVHIVVTADRHPMRHCSFESEGGKWPAHCVADTIHDWISSEKNAGPNVLKQFCPSIDGGKTLDLLISKYGLSCVR